MQDVKPKIKFYLKSELADMYGVNRRTILNWLHRSAVLKKKLKEFGYNTNSHLLTPKQVELIFEFIGEPDNIPASSRYKNEQKAVCKSYSLTELARFYEISGEQLRKIMKKTMPDDIFLTIHAVPQDEFDTEINLGKRFFLKKDVEMIFLYIGTPFVS